MKITLTVIGKTKQDFVSEGTAMFRKRIQRYTTFGEVIIPAVKNAPKLPVEELKQKEGEAILKKAGPGDMIILLDEKGKEMSSVGFAGFLEQKMNMGAKNLNFVIGGAYGFSKEVYAKCDMKLSLSKMTFSHQIIRLIFMEQLYRAFTIIRNEPYHNQ